jgi:hypothetical protein
VGVRRLGYGAHRPVRAGLGRTQQAYLCGAGEGERGPECDDHRPLRAGLGRTQDPQQRQTDGVGTRRRRYRTCTSGEYRYSVVDPDPQGFEVFCRIRIRNLRLWIRIRIRNWT